MADRSSFDLFAGLGALSKKGPINTPNLGWFDSLSAEGQKAAAPFVIMRWLSGTSDAAQIIRLNTVANQYMFAGTADKSALFKLLAVSTTGKTGRYSWIKGPGSKAKKLSIEAISQYYDCSPREAATYKVSADDMIEMAEELGWDPDEIKKLKVEIAPSDAPKKPSKRGKA